MRVKVNNQKHKRINYFVESDFQKSIKTIINSDNEAEAIKILAESLENKLHGW